MNIQAHYSANIGVDYSGSAAYLGHVAGRTVLSTASITVMDSPYSFFHTIQDTLRAWKIASPTLPELWIEAPWIQGNRFPQVALQLVRTCTILELAALECDLEPCFVQPAAWRKRVYGHGRPDDPKQRARDVAKELLGFETKFKNQHNICEGLMLAFYGQLQHNPELLPEANPPSTRRRL